MSRIYLICEIISGNLKKKTLIIVEHNFNTFSSFWGSKTPNKDKTNFCIYKGRSVLQTWWG